MWKLIANVCEEYDEGNVLISSSSTHLQRIMTQQSNAGARYLRIGDTCI